MHGRGVRALLQRARERGRPHARLLRARGVVAHAAAAAPHFGHARQAGRVQLEAVGEVGLVGRREGSGGVVAEEGQEVAQLLACGRSVGGRRSLTRKQQGMHP